MQGRRGDEGSVTRPAGASDPNSRSTLATVATVGALTGGIVKGMALDRPRIALAFPHARAQGKTMKWAAELLTGNATNDIVPITGGVVRIGSRTLTTNGWKGAYTLSTGIGLGLLGLSMTYGIPNLVDGWQKAGGPEGLTENRAGRTGVLAASAGLFHLGVMGTAIARTPGGAGRLVGALHHPIHSATGIVVAGILAGGPVLANELGFLDFMNAGDERSPLEVAGDTAGGYLQKVRDVFT
jgi:hypothetical protein